jgi:site-specific recombinase XerC
MRVVKERDGGVVRRVRLVEADGEPVAAVCRYLDHLVDRGFSLHTLCAYAYDLRRLFYFLGEEGLDWREFRGADALRLLAFLRRVGPTVTGEPVPSVVGRVAAPGQGMVADFVSSGGVTTSPVIRTPVPPDSLSG